MKTKTLLFVLFTVFSVGCSNSGEEVQDERGYKWIKTHDSIPMENRIVEVVSNGNLYLKCGLKSEAEGCSVWGRDGDDFKPDGKCWIYVPKGYAPWVLEHEHKHCDGFSHPGASLKWARGDVRR